MFNFIQRWKAKREIKKSIALIEKLCDEAPASFFKGMLRNADGTELDHIDARNALLGAAYAMKREI